jgi:hypothetical protein
MEEDSSCTRRTIDCSAHFARVTPCLSCDFTTAEFELYIVVIGTEGHLVFITSIASQNLCPSYEYVIA